MKNRPRKRRDWLATVIFLLLVAGLLFAAFVWRRYEFRECRKVGHETLYCLTHDGGSNK